MYVVLPSLASRTFTKCIDAAPLPSEADGNPNYIRLHMTLKTGWYWPDQSGNQSLTEYCHSATCRSTFSRVNCYPDSGLSFWAQLYTLPRWMTSEQSPDYSATGGFTQIGDFQSSQGFSEVARPHSGGLLCDSSGLDSYAAPPILAQSLSPPQSMWCLGQFYIGVNYRCVKSVVPWTTPRLFQPGVQTDLQEEGSHHRRLQLGLRHSVGGHPAPGQPCSDACISVAQSCWLFSWP